MQLMAWNKVLNFNEHVIFVTDKNTLFIWLFSRNWNVINWVEKNLLTPKVVGIVWDLSLFSVRKILIPCYETTLSLKCSTQDKLNTYNSILFSFANKIFFENSTWKILDMLMLIS
jgi:hypothetical protein